MTENQTTANPRTDSLKETVILEEIDGFEFEKLCARIFSKLNYGEVENTQETGDMGRDLIIHSPNGIIVVECKHHPHSSIGRPVVQKLHSAAISSNAIRGILVTSGKFSPQAVEHVKTLSPPIELIDRKILSDFATRADIELILEGKKHTVLRYPLTDQITLEKKFDSFIKSRYESAPNHPSSLITISDRAVQLLPSYMIQYDVDSTFKTTVGIIHTESLENGQLLIRGDNGKMLKPEYANHLNSAPLKTFNESDFSGLKYKRYDFHIDDSTLKSLSKEYIAIIHTKTIRYYGDNNQAYSKICKPPDKDIFIPNIKQVYIPFQDIDLKILHNIYSVFGTENSQNLLCSTDLLKCKICGSYIHGTKGILCNSCGALVHTQQLLDSHGFKCNKCGKTLCRKCTYSIGLFKYGCKECAEKTGKSIKPLPEKMNQRNYLGGGVIAVGLLSWIFYWIIGIVLILIGTIVLFSRSKSKGPEYEII